LNTDEVLPVLAGKMLGENAEKIMAYLAKRGEVTADEIVEKLGMEESEVRKILNALYENSLVKYRRMKGKDGKAAYKYYWRITDEEPIAILEARKRKTLAILRKVLAVEEGKSFYCPICGTYYTFDEAADLFFKCIKCDAVLEALENSEPVERLKRAIEVLENLDFEKAEVSKLKGNS